MGRGARDEGRGARDEGRGTRDEGRDRGARSEERDVGTFERLNVVTFEPLNVGTFELTALIDCAGDAGSVGLALMELCYAPPGLGDFGIWTSKRVGPLRGWGEDRIPTLERLNVVTLKRCNV